MIAADAEGTSPGPGPNEFMMKCECGGELKFRFYTNEGTTVECKACGKEHLVENMGD